MTGHINHFQRDRDPKRVLISKIGDTQNSRQQCHKYKTGRQRVKFMDKRQSKTVKIKLDKINTQQQDKDWGLNSIQEGSDRPEEP